MPVLIIHRKPNCAERYRNTGQRKAKRLGFWFYKVSFFLTTGRRFLHCYTGIMLRVSPKPDVNQKTGYVAIHPQDAEKLALKDCFSLRIQTKHPLSILRIH